MTIRPLVPVLCLVTCLCAEAKAAFPDNASVRLALSNALSGQRKGKPEKPRNLDLHLGRRNGKWESEVWGFARSYNQATHEGVLRVVEESEKTTRLHVEMLILDDPWVQGGFAEYDITLTHDPVKGTNGTHTGWFNGLDMSGTVEAAVAELPSPPRGYKPVEKGEHPRLLFRRHEIPELRERAETEWGRRILKAIRARLATEPDERDNGVDRSIGQGFLYSVFGEEEHGKAAAAHVRHRVWNIRLGGHAHNVARGLLMLAITFDLVHDQLTPRDLDLLSKQFCAAGGIVNQRKGLYGNWNNGPNSNWTAIGTGGAGMAMLAMLRERGRLGVTAPAACTPAEQFKATVTRPTGPVWEFRPDTLITNWLYGADKGKLSPLPVSAIQTPTVAYLDHVPACLVLPDAGPSTTTYLSTVIRAPEGVSEGIFRCIHPAGYRGANIWIDGRPVPEGAGVRLDPGQHSILLEVTGRIICPRFVGAQVGPMIGKWKRFQRTVAQYEHAAKAYRETGERQDPPFLLRTVQRHATAWGIHAVGDHGWKTETETYQIISVHMLIPFAAAYERVMGRPLARGTGFDWILPLAMARGCGGGGGGYGGKRAMGLSSSFLAQGLNLCETSLIPAMQWELERRVADDEQLKKMSCWTLVSAYVNRDPTRKTRAPSEIMPTTVVDRRKGAFVLRNRYRDGDDFVTHLFLQTERPRGPAWFLREQGSFRISGLSTAWAIGGGQGKREKEYEKENVVVVEPNTGTGLGKTLYFKQPEPGVSVMGGDLTGFHNWRTNYNITATRHMAVDYSEHAGVPALFAVIDRVTGKDRKKTWTMYTAGRDITVDGATFTIRGKRGTASMRGTVVSPSGATPTVTGSRITVESDADSVDYFILMTVQKGKGPAIAIDGTGIEATATVNTRIVTFEDGKLQMRQRPAALNSPAATTSVSSAHTVGKEPDPPSRNGPMERGGPPPHPQNGPMESGGPPPHPQNGPMESGGPPPHPQNGPMESGGPPPHPQVL